MPDSSECSVRELLRDAGDGADDLADDLAAARAARRREHAEMLAALDDLAEGGAVAAGEDVTASSVNDD